MTELPDRGVIDADGHVLEDEDLWERYLEPQFRDRPIRIVRDDQGWDVLEVAGKPFPYFDPGQISMMGTMGEPLPIPSPERRYAEARPFGSADPRERVTRLDREGLDAALLYPTIGLQWECAVPDPELDMAYHRAYNRWLADFCRDSNGRLVPIAHLSLWDVELAVAELHRAVEDGCRGAFVGPFTMTRVPHGHPDHDPFWAAAQELDVPVTLHPTYEAPGITAVSRFDGFDGLLMGEPRNVWNSIVFGTQGIKQAFASFFAFATFDRFPRLKIGVVESSAGWIGAFLDRLDTLAETPTGMATGAKELPSTYFQRQCFISADPEERSAPLILEHVGSQCFVWATDFPHGDHPANWREHLARFITPLGANTREAFLGANVRRLYGLETA
jgi:predicted TIM-barrel fold metal-dependent hydrolase